MTENPSFDEFTVMRGELLAQRPGLARFDETNLYASLRKHTGRFGPLEKSCDAKAAHRCHIAEEYLAFAGFHPEMKRRTMVSAGVRDSLAVLFGFGAEKGLRALIPCDVYPVYAELAELSGISTSTYEARLGVPDEEALSCSDMVLICDPLKPWGGEVSKGEAERLGSWAGKGGVLLVDSAYSPKGGGECQGIGGRRPCDPFAFDVQRMAGALARRDMRGSGTPG